MKTGEAVSEIIGKTITKVKKIHVFDNTTTNKNEEILFYCNDGSVFKMYPVHDNGTHINVVIKGDVFSLINYSVLDIEILISMEQISEKIILTWTTISFYTEAGIVMFDWCSYSDHNYLRKVEFVKCLNKNN